MNLPKISHRLIALLVLFSALAGVGFHFVPEPQTIAKLPPEAIVPFLPVEQVYPHVVPKQSTFFTVLRALNVDASTIQEIVDGSKPVFNFGRLSAGTRFRLNFSETDPSQLAGIDFRFSAIDKLEVRKNNGVWSAQKITEQVQAKTVTFKGVVTNNLWESAEAAGMDPNLVVQLAEIFAWQVDFAREVRLNDRWRLSVEQRFVNGEPVGWGNILAAHYENAGTHHHAIMFIKDGQPQGYFAPDGSSLKRMFLKSPIQYGRISSRFNRKRFHPVLKVSRPHLGVDYAAPTGTPIRAVGSGRVTMAGWHGGGGKTVKISHNSMYQTSYLHLSRFAPGLRAGSRVNQGQVIGYVGSTGLSTGPHLHFEFWHSGRVVDPLGQKFPTADPVPHQHMDEFRGHAAVALNGLPSWEDETSTVTAVNSSSILED